MNSFSAKIKEELGQINNLAKKDQVRAELTGYLFVNNSKVFSTESDYNINRLGKLLNNCGIDDFKIAVKGKNFVITMKKIPELDADFDNEILIKSFIRGCFMASGSVTNPKNVYHLEILFDDKEKAEVVKSYLVNVEINAKVLKRKDKYTLYMKDGDDISNFLAFIDANKAMLSFEDERVVKEVRNKVNRMVNYETANLNKVVATSVKQIEDIKFIKKKNKFNKLSQKEQDLAEVRLKNPNASLAELGKLVIPEISKSGVTHRMASISKLADELRK